MNDSFLGYIVLIFIVFVVIAVVKSRGKISTVEKYDVGYEYKRKEHLMTRAEQDFFDTLVSLFGEDYYIFPQMQLSRILDSRAYHQNWKAAFARISQKSVDYIICDKVDIKPLIAIELDDSTHDSEIRQERDKLVNAIFDQVGIPLIHARDVENKSREFIKDTITEALDTQK